jgi:hypothetical protein
MNFDAFKPYVPVLQVLAGGIVAGFFALFGIARTYRNNRKLVAQQKQSSINGLLRLIRFELEILGQQYLQTSGDLLGKLPDGQPYHYHFSLTEKYFIAYPANTGLVSQIDDVELCKAIVVTYNRAHFLIEIFRINNHYLDKLAENERLENQNHEDKLAAANLTAIRGSLALQARILKDVSKDLKRETENLFAKIESYLVKHEPTKSLPPVATEPLVRSVTSGEG